MYRLMCFGIGYAFGCISIAYILGKILKVDLRTEGSGNLGTTNALRVLGKKAGVITFVGDILKGVVPFLLCKMLFSELEVMAGLYGGFGAIIGHIFPFYLHFKGGKGIATSIGVMTCVSMCVAPWLTPVIGILAFGTAGITKYISAGSILFMVLTPIGMMFVRFNLEGLLIVTGICLLIILKHHENIKRLCTGTERKFYGS